MPDVLAAISLQPSFPIEGAGLFVSQKAENQILLILADELKKPQRLRVSITGGGCAGFQYMLSFDINRTDEDIIFSSPQEVEIIIDKMSYEILQGSTIDYIDELMGSTFIIKNPNAASSCGCGNSFSVI